MGDDLGHSQVRAEPEPRAQIFLKPRLPLRDPLKFLLGACEERDPQKYNPKAASLKPQP